MARCLLCRKGMGRCKPHGLCEGCHATLAQPVLRYQGGSSLYRYEGGIRELVLRAKVQGELAALQCLRHLWQTHPHVAEALTALQAITPMPSSLWGRWQGRVDIAYFFAADCAHKAKCSLRLAPFSSHWRWQKRSFIDARQAHPLEFSSQPCDFYTLLVDDVLTTGYSLNRLASQINGKPCRFLTLCSAYPEMDADSPEVL